MYIYIYICNVYRNIVINVYNYIYVYIYIYIYIYNGEEEWRRGAPRPSLKVPGRVGHGLERKGSLPSLSSITSLDVFRCVRPVIKSSSLKLQTPGLSILVMIELMRTDRSC